MRIELVATNETLLLANFGQARDRARANIKPIAEGAGAANYHPPPRNLREYLADNLRREFELRYYVLDRAQFDASFVATAGYRPLLLTKDKDRSGKDILNSLLRVDFLHAQPHLSDIARASMSEGPSRSLIRLYVT